MSFRGVFGSRRAPWPAHMIVGGIPAYFKSQQGVALYSKKEIAFENVSPQVFDYASADPYKKVSYPFRDLFLGAGEVAQIGRAPTHRYRECKNVDFSLGFAIKGPHFHTYSPAHTGSVADIVEGLHGGTPTLFALCGQYVQRLQADDTWTESKDLGAGVAGKQAVRFKSSGGGAVDGLYVANTGAFVQQYDGANWHDCGEPGTTIDVRREELWFGYLNTIRKVAASPLVAGNFAAALTIGDASANVTWLSHVFDQLVIFKETGIFSLDVDLGTSTVVDADLFPNIAKRSVKNGVNAQVWLGSELFAPFGGGLWRIEPQYGYGNPTQLSINPIPLNLRVTTDGIDFGTPVATAGHNDWTNYVAMYNADTNTSYIGKYGKWVPPQFTGAPDFTFVKSFDIAIKEFESKQITSMRIWGRAGENQRLWVGFADGDVAWCKLPNNSPDPSAESVANGGACEFNTDEGYFRWPRINAGFEAITKLWRDFSAFGPHITDTDKVRQQFRTDLTSTYDELADAFTSSGETHDMSATLISKELDCKTLLDNDSINSTPVVEGMALSSNLRPDETFEHTGVFDCHEAKSGRNGAVRLRTARELRDRINEQMQSAGSVTCVMPDGTTQNLIFLDHAENLQDIRGSSGLEWELPFKAVNFTSDIALGTYRRLRTWTYRQLKQLRYRGIPKI